VAVLTGPGPGVLTLADLADAIDREAGGRRPGRESVSEDRLQEHAISALHGLRGLSKADKRKVLRRMSKLLDA